MKKLVAFLLILSLAAVAGCGSQNGAGGGSGANSDEVFKLKMATHYHEGHPAMTAFAEAVEEIKNLTNGKVEITIYPSSQLGDYSQNYEELMKGSLDMAFTAISSIYDAKLELPIIPYLVTDYTQMETVFGPESYFHKEYSKIHDALGVKLLGVYIEGLIGIGCSKMPESYQDPAANKNMLLRVPELEVYDTTMLDCGFQTVAINATDLYSSLQTGVCDGWIGGTPSLNYSNFRDAIKYFISYNILPEPIGLMMSKQTYETLPQEYQAVISDVMMKVALGSYQSCKDDDTKGKEDLAAYGVEIIELSEAEMKAYSDYVRSTTWPKLYDKFGQELLDGLLSSLS